MCDVLDRAEEKGRAEERELIITLDNILIEVNDGYALGSYGLFYLDYAKLLSARWAELIGIQDECNF